MKPYHEHSLKIKNISYQLIGIFFILFHSYDLRAEGTRLLRQPSISDSHIAFVYGGDIWISGLQGGDATRLTSTPATESNPYFSPDGKFLAFSSNRTGTEEVYIVPIEGGTPTRLTWHPSGASVRGWSPDGKSILYASSRGTAPSSYNRLWTVSVDGGPSVQIKAPRGERAAFGPNNKLVIEPISRWDVEWRAYRGGQNTPLLIFDQNDLSEKPLDNERTTDIYPVWMNDIIYFLSDRDWVSNIWSYDPASDTMEQLTDFEGADIKYLSGNKHMLVYEREGYLHTFDPSSKESRQLSITVRGDFPWAETRIENVSSKAGNASLSPSGKRIILEARGEIFTVPVEDGSSRNLSRSSDEADRSPLWSPKGDKVAWFSDKGGNGYQLLIGSQDGLKPTKGISIGESKMAWQPAWSPDGKYIAFVDNKVRVRIIDIDKETVRTVDTGGVNIERGSMGLAWSPDSRWLAYAKSGSNYLRKITLWSVDSGETKTVTDPMADSFSPAWDGSGKYIYFLASTDIALASGWANTSSMKASPTHGAYVIVLSQDETTPFPLKSDEEQGEESASESGKDKKSEKETDKKQIRVKIDFDGIERRTLAMSLPLRSYNMIMGGPNGTAFIGESVPNTPGLVLHKFTLAGQKNEEFAKGVSNVKLSENREKILFKSGGKWRVVTTSKKPDSSDGNINVDLRMELDRKAEWKQIFDEAWRYEKDYFYDPNIHGRNWDEVKERYEPLIPYIRHRSDLTYVLDQMNGELSVGHSFVFGGDYPAVDTTNTGLLGADLEINNGKWQIKRIYTSESWNPELKAPLDQPGLKVKEGQYLLAVNGVELSASEEPFRLFAGTAGKQTVLHINDHPSMEGAHTVTVEPIKNENGLRQRAWVEDNRRKVDELSDGKLAYVWVPNTGSPGYVSFNRYFFAQQDKAGAVIDERYNGGGLLDDYMVDLMTRKLRAAITNEVPDAEHFRLPAGILGPKVLLINEMAGSGGDFFPWVFRNQNAGPLIGKRTWGGLVKSSVHYAFIDGGAMTSPDNAVFDPIRNEWIGENKGIAPDIEIGMDAKSVAEGRDVQLEAAVKEALRLLELEGRPEVVPPAFPTPALRPQAR